MLKRLAAFKDNKDYIEKHNAVEKDFKLAINHLADLTEHEY